MSYLIIVIGLACYLCPWIAENIIQELYSSDIVNNEYSDITFETYKIIVYSQYLYLIAAMLTCFYYVIAAKRNRNVKAYLVSVGVSIFFSVLYSFYGVKEAIISGYKEAMGDVDPVNGLEIAEMVNNAINAHLYFFNLILAINIGFIILLMWLSYKSLYRSNL